MSILTHLSLKYLPNIAVVIVRRFLPFLTQPDPVDYYQCQPGAAPAPATSSAPASTPAPTTTTGSKPPTTTATGPSASGVGPGMTLQTGYYWIRAVADPNFHKYLQTKPVYTTGIALLESYTTAGQFQIVDGQLVQLIDTKGTLLYANVTPQTDSSNTKLAVTFLTTKNTYGAFKWSGDALQWSISTITRPNESAWLVCANQQLFINLGSYGYMTPAGCSDQTVWSRPSILPTD